MVQPISRMNRKVPLTSLSHPDAWNFPEAYIRSMRENSDFQRPNGANVHHILSLVLHDSWSLLMGRQILGLKHTHTRARKTCIHARTHKRARARAHTRSYCDAHVKNREEKQLIMILFQMELPNIDQQQRTF